MSINYFLQKGSFNNLRSGSVLNIFKIIITA